MTTKARYEDGEPTLLPIQARTARKSKGTRIRVYLALLSTAAILSTVLPAPWTLFRERRLRRVTVKTVDPASEWQDNIWPIREQTPWDISTDYQYPRLLEYNVTEGTWLRLDVNPASGDIIFDMVGDIYCLPGSQVLGAVSGKSVHARPVLRGVPFDTDPHFSPDGDRFVFRSDAGLGIENIWISEWRGCDAMDISIANTQNEELQMALRVEAQEEALLREGILESKKSRHNRLVREGRAWAHRVTNETYRWVSDARFHPSGTSVIATKWYTSSRSLGAGEGWQYEAPSLEKLHRDQKHISVGSGFRVLGRSLPLGWTVDGYESQQIGPEQFIWLGEDTMIYAKNVKDANAFEYSKDVHKGIYSIFQRNLTTGTTETLVDAYPGGASRPELSRDRRTLAFVRRVRDKEALVLKDLHTGTLHYVWFGLTYDLTAISAPMGTYPSFAFSPSDDAVIIWAAGQIYHVPLGVNHQGEKVASGTPSPIRFHAHISKKLARTLKGGVDILQQETAETQRVYSLKNLRVDEIGERTVFEGAGLTYVHDFRSKQTRQIPVSDKASPYYSPSFVPGRSEFVIHARWSDTNFTSFELANLETGAAHEFEGLPLGRYLSPVACECPGSSKRLAFVKTGEDTLTGGVVAIANPGLYIADFELPSSDGQRISLKNIKFVSSNLNPDDRVNMRFFDGSDKLLVQDSQTAFTINLKNGQDGNGDYEQDTIASGRMSAELAISPSGKDGIPDYISFVDFFHVYLAPGEAAKDEQGVWSKPANATKGLARLSLDGGHDITWSRDGKRVFWLLGPFIHSLEVSKLRQCASAVEQDRLNFGISCVHELVDYQEVIIEHSTDIARLKQEVASLQGTHKEWLDIRDGSDLLIITNATILTMETGHVEGDLIEDGILVTRGGVIEYAGPISSDFSIPVRAQTIDAQGGFVIPGFIDVHAHWDGFMVKYPAKSWEMETFLAYGVTTLHNPSADNVEGFIERSRVERGLTIGPRIYTVGDIIYGAGLPVHQDIVTQDEANSALLRIKAQGGPASISYKNYNIPSRASRQRLLGAAYNMSMLCVPEGGMNYDWDLTYIIDGMTTVEHAIPVPVLYDDVQTLFALSGTGSTPTHIVNYGGAFGEQFVWAHYDVPNNPKLRRFTRHDILEGISESTARPSSSYALFNTSTSVAKMTEMGLLTHIGAHGEPPLGLNYHAEMWFAKQGGLSNYDVIRAATSSGARTLGLFSSLGSLSAGKLADYIVYPAGVNLLNDDISSTKGLAYVARGGRLWNASTMEEVWPVKGRKQEMPPFNAE